MEVLHSSVGVSAIKEHLRFEEVQVLNYVMIFAISTDMQLSKQVIKAHLTKDAINEVSQQISIEVQQPLHVVV